MPDTPDFDAMYRRDPDPFAVRSSWYERRKLAVLLASLSQPSYAAAWDPACGTGDLALALAERCDRVLATDRSERAVQITRDLTAAAARVEARRHTLPDQPPGAERTRSFDLVLVAEVLYYLPIAARRHTYELLDQVTSHETPAEVVAVHWRHHPHDGHLSGAEVTDELGAALCLQGWTRLVRHEDPDFVLASWARGPRDGRR